MSETGLVNRIIPFSCVDGPGNRSAIFFQGCDFRCRYCHNPETQRLCVACGDCVEVCPTGALQMDAGRVRWMRERCCGCDACIGACENYSTPKTRQMDADEILGELRTALPFVTGITVSGGECTMHHPVITELFRKVHELGKTAFVDTNGQRSFREMPELMEEMDMAMLDVKAFSEESHQRLTGCSNRVVLENLQVLAEAGKLYEVRTVILPELLDNEETVREVSRILKAYPEVRYKLIKYRPWGVRPPLAAASPTDAAMQALAELALRHGASYVELT